MKRINSLIKLSHDHNAALMLALGLKKNAPPLKSIPDGLPQKAEFAEQFYKTELINHFTEEEEILFPYIVGKDPEIDKLIPELLNDHKKLSGMFLSINKENVSVEELSAIGDLLRQHIRKEERYLFELIQKHFTDEELETILSSRH